MFTHSSYGKGTGLWLKFKACCLCDIWTKNKLHYVFPCFVFYTSVENFNQRWNISLSQKIWPLKIKIFFNDGFSSDGWTFKIDKMIIKSLCYFCWIWSRHQFCRETTATGSSSFQKYDIEIRDDALVLIDRRQWPSTFGVIL